MDQRELQTYDGFLASLGLQDRQEELAEYLTNDDKLAELKEYDDDELDEDILDELGFDERTKEKFHEALRELKDGNEVDKQEEKPEFHPDTMAAAVEAASLREERWPKWSLLESTLGMKQVDANAAATNISQELITKLEAENEAKDKAIAEKDEELAQMREQLAKFEAVPP